MSVLLLLIIILSLAPAFWAILNDANTDKSEISMALVILGASILLVVVLLFGMRYEIEENDLAIKLVGFSIARVQIKDIVSVKRSYNPLSSPASSLKRLYVKSKGKDLIISPVREDEFARALKSRNPDIEFEITHDNAWYRFWDWDI